MRRMSTVGAAAVAASLVVAMAPAAQAAKGDCAANRMCGWHDQRYSSTLVQYVNDFSDLNSNSDEFDSVYNRTSVAWLLFDDKGYGGTQRCLAPGASDSDLGQFGDKISSMKKRVGPNKANCKNKTPL